MKEAIVLYPSPAMGHIVSMVELGKLILTHIPSLSINILITTPPFKAASNNVTTYINHVSTTTPSITFHHLPTISLPPPNSSTTSLCPHVTLMFELLHRYDPDVHQTLLSISQTHTIQAFIIDLFCTSALVAAAKLNVPSYYFMTSGIGVLAAFSYFPSIHNNTAKSLKDLNCNLDIPGFLQSIPAIDMPEPLLERSDKAYQHFLDFCHQIPKSAGIIVNSFETLEPTALKALSGGLCVPNTSPMPPIFCIGPLIATDDGGVSGDCGGQSDECLTWLDLQPSRSVVFLCFGSLGLFSSPQLKEIAIGLERSEQRFLWVVRNPPPDDKNKSILALQSDPDLDSLLPDGFLDRTKGRGLVIKKWAPQVTILNHDSVGGFVTHCGWNSVLESVCAGVPMVAWPLYAEQRLNRVVLVEELKLALPIKETEGGFVRSDEVEKRVCQLMGTKEGNSVRKRVMARRDEAMVARSEGGSSQVSLAKFIHSLSIRCPNKYFT